MRERPVLPDVRVLLDAAVVAHLTGTSDALDRGMALQTSTEYRGVGQSGYTAGRHEADPALEREIETRNKVLPRGCDEEQFKDELATDDRFSGRGGIPPRDEPPSQ